MATTPGPKDIKPGTYGEAGDLDEFADGPGGLIDDEVEKDATSEGGMDRMRERATNKAMGKGPGSGDKEGDYVDVDGAGGYRYRWTRDGDIRILKAPNGRGEGLTLSRASGGKAYDAIADELSKRQDIVAKGEGAGGHDWTFPAPAAGGGERADRNSDGLVDVRDLNAASRGVAATAVRNADKQGDDTARTGMQHVAEAKHKQAQDRATSASLGAPKSGDQTSRETAQRNAQIGTTVGKGVADVKMAKEEASRDMARAALEDAPVKKFEWDTPDVAASSEADDIMAAAKAEATKLLESGDALEASRVLNEAVEKAKALKSKSSGGDAGGPVARAVEARRKSMGI